MKKLKITLAFLLASLLMMSTGCLTTVIKSKKKAADKSKEQKAGQKSADDDDADPDDADSDGKKKGEKDSVEMKKEFGTYTISGEWVEVKSQSMAPDIFTYCLKGNEDSQTPPNNIVVRHDSNQYTKEQHVDFSAAILQQIKGQAASYGGEAHMEGYGEINGCMVYQFVYECDPYCVQWYFCGEKEYVMVGMTIFDEEATKKDNIWEVAQALVDSFVWTE
ncbi:MAG: hypothetical protein J5750_03060 [Clostridiales bacterium]|nr:hypothetical protein [Clostridiales bacterium]